MSDTILSNDNGDWVELTLNRPDKLNSFNCEMHLALREHLKRAFEGPARAVLITGAGRGFCAGQDLGDRDPSKLDGPPDLSQTLTDFYNPLVRMLRDAECPVICAVNGVAAGSGANLALACDMVVASDQAKFIQSFGRVGLVPDAGGTWSLTRALGPMRAKAVALTGQPITAAQAEAWGLVWQVVAPQDLMPVARDLTARIASGPTVGFANTKKAINAATTNTLEAQLELEAKLQKACGETSDYAEGVSAFLSKRTPEFKGK